MKKGIVMAGLLFGVLFPILVFAGEGHQSVAPPGSQLRVEQELVVLSWEMALDNEEKIKQVVDEFYLSVLYVFTFQENLLYGKVEIKQLVGRMAPKNAVLLTKYIRFLNIQLEYYHKRGAVDPQQYRNIHGSLAYILESIEE